MNAGQRGGKRGEPKGRRAGTVDGRWFQQLGRRALLRRGRLGCRRTVGGRRCEGKPKFGRLPYRIGSGGMGCARSRSGLVLLCLSRMATTVAVGLLVGGRRSSGPIRMAAAAAASCATATARPQRSAPAGTTLAAVVPCQFADRSGTDQLIIGMVLIRILANTTVQRTAAGLKGLRS